MEKRLLHFRPPVADDAQMLLAWRTRPDIARNMYSAIDPDPDRQRAWLEAMTARSDYRHFIIGSGGQPIGYLSYSQIDPVHRRCLLGSYVGVRDTPGRAASYLYWYVMDYAFYRLGLNKVVSEVLDTNPSLIKGLRLCGEREVGVLREHIRKDDGYHDVHVFEVLRRDWDKAPRVIDREDTLAAFDEP